jgi:hypothetical protein
MTLTLTKDEAARFLRTLRVSTQTALARHHLSEDHRSGRTATTFLALAAKGVGDWHFPESGVASSDGLLVARVVHTLGEAPFLEIQAQGLSGLSLYVGRAARIALLPGLALGGTFDRDGRLRLPLEEGAVSDLDLSAFDLQLLDDKP